MEDQTKGYIGVLIHGRQVLKLAREMGSEKNIWSETRLQMINSLIPDDII